ncbi:hypothetical protein BDU57DRAFT_304717 [Ampelomyces quisqualis]|uniref:Uncharacterized protein n=1 Tax=Ampelomyces quisqualis TaxID=50730 RepID=A0A6A5QJD0_AMPQU|nr:hypothetical protein BDU57DRAFT_304717 [Ampelomyces quisqualis]
MAMPEESGRSLYEPPTDACPLVLTTQDPTANDTINANVHPSTKTSAPNKRKRKTKTSLAEQDGRQMHPDTAAKASPGDVDSDGSIAPIRQRKKAKTANTMLLQEDDVVEQGQLEQDDSSFGVQNDDEEKDGSVDGDDPAPTRSAKVKSKGKAMSNEKMMKKDKTPIKLLTEDEYQAFTDGVEGMQDWSSSTMKAHFVKVIEWFDKDGFTVDVIREKYTALRYGSGEKPKTWQNMYKLYKTHAPKFYAEKGIFYATRGERTAYRAKYKASKHGRNAVATVETGGNVGADQQDAVLSADKDAQGSGEAREAGAPKPSTADQKLYHLFTKVITSSSSAIRIARKCKPARDNGPVDADVVRYHANRNSKDVLYFGRAAGDAILGHPSRPVLDRQCAARSCEYLRDALRKEPELQIIYYADGIEDLTVHRFVACVSPCVRASLPTHDLAEISRNGEPFLQATQIQWSMQNLIGLYVFARQMDAAAVCDMVMDRWHKEIHRPTFRTIRDEDGEMKTFSILQFGPEFLEFLSKTDEQGLDFFTDVLIMMKRAGRDLLAAHGFWSWNAGAKNMLEKKLKKDDVPLLTSKDLDYICEQFHHHHDNGGECYKVQARFVESLPSAGTSGHVESRTNDGRFDPIAWYWERQKHFQEAGEHTTEAMVVERPKRKCRNGNGGLAALERRELKRLRQGTRTGIGEEDEEDMSSITMANPLPVDDYHEDEDDEVAAAAPPKLVDLGITYSEEQGGNGPKDSKEKAEAKYKAIKAKLLVFKKAGYDIGSLEGGEGMDVDDGEELEDDDDDDGEGESEEE